MRWKTLSSSASSSPLLVEGSEKTLGLKEGALGTREASLTTSSRVLVESALDLSLVNLREGLGDEELDTFNFRLSLDLLVLEVIESNEDL